MKKKNAFTLIELLAIIVILAIIAVITIPILLNVIENSRKGAAIDSAYGYKDAISKYYVTELSGNPSYNFNGTYKVSALKDMGVSVSGQEPSDGWVTIKQGGVIDYSIKIGNYTLSPINDETEAVKNGDIKESPEPQIARIASDGRGYVDGEYVKNHPVFYNPVSGEYCNKDTDSVDNKYVDNNSLTGYNGVEPGEGQTSCLMWYAYSVNEDGTKNMILDHNATLNIAWNNTDENNFNGPDQDFKNALKNTTEEWLNVPTRSDSYNASWGDDNHNYTISYNGYKARIISFEEVLNIINYNQTAQYGQTIYFGRNTWNISMPPFMTENSNVYSWLYDNTENCKQYGCKKEVINNSDTIHASKCTTTTCDIPENINYLTAGYYWTSSPDANYDKGASNVTATGNLGTRYIPFAYRSWDTVYYPSGGIRPVITIN